MPYMRAGCWYRSVRLGPSVRTEYLGTGRRGEVLAMLHAEDTAEAAAARAERREIARAGLEAFRGARRLATEADDLVKDGLEACGFHRAQRRASSSSIRPTATIWCNAPSNDCAPPPGSLRRH